MRMSVTRQQDLMALGVLLVVGLVVLWPVTVGGKVMLPADLLLRMEPWHAHAGEYSFTKVQNPILDAVQQFYPWRKYAAETVREDEIPLWNPLSSCGAPFVANNQSAVFYPETWLFYVIQPTERAFGWVTLFFFMLAGGFMYWYLRTVGCRPVAALLGALPFMLCGFFVGWLAFPTFRSVPAWLSLMLVGHEKMLQARAGENFARKPWWLLTAVAVGMQFLAGNVHISFFVLLTFAGYVVFRAVQAKEWKSAGFAGIAFGIGCMIGAVQLLPVAELALMGSRPAYAYEFVLKHAMIPIYLLAGLMPDLFGNPVDYNHWGQHLFGTLRTYVETAWYVGVGTLIFAAAAMYWRKTKLEWFWAGAALVGFGLGWGTWLYWLVFHVVPPLQGMPGIGRAVVIIDVALAVLAGLGVEALLRILDERQGEGIARFASISATVALVVGGISGLYVWFMTGALEKDLPGIGGYTLLQVGIYAALVVVSCGLITLVMRNRRLALVGLVFVVALDMGHFARKFMPQAPAEYLHVATETVDAMSGQQGEARMMSVTGPGNWMTRMPANMPMAFGLENMESSDSLTVKWYDEMLSETRGADEQFRLELPLWDALNVKYLVTTRDVEGRWGRADVGENDLYVNSGVLPRVYSPAGIVPVGTFAAARKYVTSGAFRPADELVTVSSMGTTSSGKQGDYAEGHVVLWSGNRVDVEIGGCQRWWVLADTFYPGWHAYAGGKEIEIAPVNYTLRGFRPEAQNARVSFVYYPVSFLLGGFLSVLGLMAACFWLAFCRRRTGNAAV